MSIRTKLLLFLPLLVLLVNLVTFLLFASGTLVQRSYGLMMDRILLYNETAHTAEDSLRRLYSLLTGPEERLATNIEQLYGRIKELRKTLAAQTNTSLPSAARMNYTHMLDTLMEQEQKALEAAANRSALAAVSHYEEAEKTTGFIREEGQRLIELELTAFEPIYRQISGENARMTRLAMAVLVINTLMSIALALWISRSITVPVSRLVQRVRSMSKGNLEDGFRESETPSRDELGLLSAAFGQMSSELKLMIEKDKQSLEKDKLVKELELQALQSQINPHFLFNTLNVLSKLALIEGAERTSDLIVSMSNLLRYNLRTLDQPVRLKDELEHIREYFTIQQARFRDRIRFELSYNEAVLSVQVPALTLQPIVENAFVHGLEGMEKGALLRLDIRRVTEGVQIAIQDNGRGMTEEMRQALLRLEGESDKKQSTGLGTRNVFKRLQLFYGRHDLVSISSTPGKGTTVTLLLPQREEGEML
ncbi:sensor histidine kinase [Paenibacillus silviterrae]|uniref:sensor histidine kinase n=1 Tax=Paenibacillus silviterrae TaxID=3242194 RepID=UPI0032B1F403